MKIKVFNLKNKILSVLLCMAFILQTVSAVQVVKADTDWSGYTAISTKEQLDSIHKNLGAKYYLTCDIVFTADDFAPGGEFYNNCSGWNPIGTINMPFTGIFDGNGHTISGLQCNLTSTTSSVYAGLFGYNSGNIQNIGMVIGNIAAESTFTSYVGGITGSNSGAISNCYYSGSIMSNSCSIGGIAGINSGTISSCFNAGSLNGGASGGITGDNWGTITYCYNAGNVKGSGCGGGAGGISVLNNNIISNCYNIGYVSFISCPGGIAGTNLYGFINNCYNIGNVIGSYAGGIVGFSSSTISNCYYLNNSSKGVGSGADTCVPLTLAQMKQQSSYIGFDFTNLWKMSPSYLPYLQAFPYVGLASMSFTASTAQLGTGGTYQTKIVFTPGFPTFISLQYTSLDTAIATVNQNGIITAVSPGTTTVIVKDLLTGKVALLQIIVSKGVNGINISGYNSINTGETVQLYATVTPTDAGNQTLAWSSSDTSIATVDQNGLVSTYKGGTVTIYATSTDGTNIQGQFTMTVVQNAQSVSLNQSTITLKTGQAQALTAIFTPADTTNKNVTWSSDTPSVAAVDSNGNVTAISRGIAVITATTEDDGFTATCTVTVTQPVTGVSLVQSTVNIGIGKQIKLVPVIAPVNANDQNVTWESSDPCVTVDSDGTITGNYAGTSVITVTTEDGGMSSMCVVNVGSAVTAISLNKSQMTLIEGLSDTLSASSISPSDAINQTVTWQSSNPSIAAVDANGKVTAIAPGSAIITCQATDGSGIFASCNVTVNAKCLQSIAVTTLPTKLTYYETDSLDTAGMVLTLTYDNGTTDNVISGWQASCDFYTSGAKTVTISYDGQITTFKVTVNPFVVTFNSEGGSSVSSQFADFDTTIDPPAAPTKTGYTFGGWYTDDGTFANEFDFANTTITGDTTLYAKWIDVCDINKDGEVNIMDLASIAQNYNARKADVNWNPIFDFNKDGIVDIFDLVICSKKIIN